MEEDKADSSLRSSFSKKPCSQTTWIFGEETNPEIPVNKGDYIKNLGIDTIDLNSASHIISVGKTKSGKSTMIS